MNTYGYVLNYGHNNCRRRNMDKITFYEINNYKICEVYISLNEIKFTLQD